MYFAIGLVSEKNYQMKCVWETRKNQSRSNRSPHPHPSCEGNKSPPPHNGFSSTSPQRTDQDRDWADRSILTPLAHLPCTNLCRYDGNCEWTFVKILVRFWLSFFIFWNTIFVNLMSTIEPCYSNVETEERYSPTELQFLRICWKTYSKPIIFASVGGSRSSQPFAPRSLVVPPDFVEYF